MRTARFFFLVIWCHFHPLLATFEDNTCPKQKLSGVAYSKTQATLKAVQKWLASHQTALEALKFLPTIQPKEPGSILSSPTELKKEKEAKSRKAYAKSHLSNEVDYVLRKELDKYELLINGNPKKAHNGFKKLYVDFKSPRALFGMGVALNKLALRTAQKAVNLKTLTDQELESVKRTRKENPVALQPFNNEEKEATTASKRMFDRSHQRHQEAMQLQGKAAHRFCTILKLEDVPLFLFMLAGRTCIELRRHRQETVELIGALKLMKNKFPNSMEYSSKLALEYLKRRQFSKAITELSHIVERWPSQKSSKEKVLLQLALKWTEKSTKDEIKNVIKTCSTLSDIGQTVKELAEGYQRAGHIKEATFLYQEGATSGLFVSTWQRMIIDNDLFIQGLTAKPTWELSELGSIGRDLKQVASNWQIIRKEGLQALFGSHLNYQEEASQLHKEGKWQQLVLFENGSKHEHGCELAPKTCQLLEKYLSNSAVSCKRGQIKFSVMHSGTHVLPHTGPTNTRLRAHLGLMIPENGLVELRVGPQTLRWSEGKVFVIDDSFEHEVWHAGDGLRLVLLMDFWHPDLSAFHRNRLQSLPVQELSQNRSTVFHIGGIVNEITEAHSATKERVLVSSSCSS